MATKVKLRQKEISGNRNSLYLDFYPPIPHPETGEDTRRQFLGMHLFVDKAEFKKKLDAKKKAVNNEKQQVAVDKLNKQYKAMKPLSSIDKIHNTETLAIAESIRQKKDNYLNKPEIYTQFEKAILKQQELGKQCFVKYFQKLTDQRYGSNNSSWKGALNYLVDYTEGSVKFADLNIQYFDDFKNYLLTTKSKRSSKTTLSRNSAVAYFNKVKAALKQAYKEGILPTDLNAKVETIKEAETRREHLTLEELNNLVKTPCNNPLMKRAALFSALTGLRFSDIHKMKWGELEYIKNQGYVLKFKHKKTKQIDNLPISDQAYSITEGTINPKKMPKEEQVFNGLMYSAYHNKHLYQWIGAAGITKDITFHCFRHTYATLQLFSGTDIYTVSKMLGHKDLKTTQIYAKIVDEAKRETVNKIKLDF